MLLIDGDVICYRAGFAAERRIVEIDPEDGSKITRIEVEPLDHALQNVKEIIEHCLTRLGVSDYHIYLTGKKNFRKEVATIREYKANRKNARYPIHLDDIKQYLIKNHPTTISEGQEADDELGIALTKSGDSGIIVSNDKDMLMVPGKHFIFTKDEKVLVTEESGKRHFWTQVLTGDSTDNIMGCPMIGPKKAEKALDGITDEQDYYDIVYGLYKRQLAAKPPEGITLEGDTVQYTNWRTEEEVYVDLSEFITEIGQLLWIRRQPDELWQPPQSEDV
jgi:5'-3' exonuclease